jgi:hypothetical protein
MLSRNNIHRIALLSLVLLSMMMGEAESLVSFAMNVRKSGFWGMMRGRQNVEQVTPVPILPIESLSSSEEMGGFDPDVYRKEMTDLVYQRSLDRFSS